MSQGLFLKTMNWLLDTKMPLPASISDQLKNGLFSSLPIFVGGVINAMIVAVIAASRHPYLPFLIWLNFEVVLGLIRMAVLLYGKHQVAARKVPPRNLSAFLSCMWALSVGIGTSLCLLVGDWLLATIACLSAAAMVCGICLRNFGTPRLAATMVGFALGPCAIAGSLTDDPLLSIISLQLPVFTFTIFSASFALHKMLVTQMTALSDLERSESLTDTILRSSPDTMMIVEEDYQVVFSNQDEESSFTYARVGQNWLKNVAEESRDFARDALEVAKSGQSVNFALSCVVDAGAPRWFDVAINGTTDASKRLLIVARDITHQKKSEEHAVWMAQHDALTGLANRTLLQEHLDQTLVKVGRDIEAAMLIIDVDKLKTINDTVGHDGGDAVLRTFADRLTDSVGPNDIVARTGGDEFALVVSVRSEAEVATIAERIFDQLSVPINHNGRLLECGASIGASLIPRDGVTRSEILKTADIALYSAKSGGRAQLRIFEPAMMTEVRKHQTMIALARKALAQNRIIAYYQPKINLSTSEIVGFEALLRWVDANGEIQTPASVKAAFDDPALGILISERMLQNILDDVQRWTRLGKQFGHIAINVSGTDFKDGNFANRILLNLAERNLSPSCVQIEVTENVFLGDGASIVARELRKLNEHGIRIALDDFGTGYASLSHLTQFPVDILKIDRSFIMRIGTHSDAKAITSAVVHLGQSLGLEIVAEGVETLEQADYLTSIGCEIGQGFLYSRPMPAETVTTYVSRNLMSCQLPPAC